MIRCLQCKRFVSKDVIQESPNNDNVIYKAIYNVIEIIERKPILWINRKPTITIHGTVEILFYSYDTAYTEHTLITSNMAISANTSQACKEMLTLWHKEGYKLQCKSCSAISDIEQAMLFYIKGSDYYIDEPLCSCGGEVTTSIGTGIGNRITAVTACDRCDTQYNKQSDTINADELLNDKAFSSVSPV